MTNAVHSEQSQIRTGRYVPVLGQLQLRAWQLRLDAGRRLPGLHDLRAAWSSALAQLSADHFASVVGSGATARPRYILRFSRQERRAIEFILLGDVDEETQSVVWQAWERAGCMGVGPQHKAIFIDEVCPLSSDGTVGPPSRRHSGFRLSEVQWPLPADQPCVLLFRRRLRLIKQGRLLRAPDLADLVLATVRRLQLHTSQDLREFQDRWLEVSRKVPCDRWRGQTKDYAYYSTAQQRRIRMSAIVGQLRLPHGPRELAPLFAALRWLHVGQATTIGLGQLTVRACHSQSGRRTWSGFCYLPNAVIGGK